MRIEIGFKLAHMNHTREYVVLAQHCFHEAVDDLLSRSAMERRASLCPLKKALHGRRGFRVNRTCQSQIRHRRYSWLMQWAVVEIALLPLGEGWEVGLFTGLAGHPRP